MVYISENIAVRLLRHPAVVQHFAETMTAKQLLALKEIHMCGIHPACVIADFLKNRKEINPQFFTPTAEMQQYIAQFPESASWVCEKHLQVFHTVLPVPQMREICAGFLFWSPTSSQATTAATATSTAYDVPTTALLPDDLDKVAAFKM
jgi:hypothetical protein